NCFPLAAHMKPNKATEQHSVVQNTPSDKYSSTTTSERRLLAGTTLIAPELQEIDIVLRELSVDEIRRFIGTTQSVPAEEAPSAHCSQQGEEKKLTDEPEVSKTEENEISSGVDEASVHEGVDQGEHEIMASPPQAEVMLAPEPSGKESKESAIEVGEVNEEGLVEDIFRGDSNTSKSGGGGLVDAILAMIGKLPLSETNADADSLNLMRYRKREPQFDEGVEEFTAVVDDKRVAEVVKAANQEMINRIIQKCSATRLAIEPNKPFTPMDDSTSFMEALKRPPSSSVPITVPIKQRKGDKGPPLRRTKCRYCGGNLRAIDKHRDDGKFALECRKRECLRFNGFTDDRSLIQSLKKPKSEYGWYLSNPMRIYYQLRPKDEVDVEDEPPPKKTVATEKAIMVRCPGQKRLCLLA
uniref:Uncharacterized protein n=1 Tax=Parascaris univalens TaxID=6257 RepID=A0A915AHQ0_PARUN